MGNLFQFIKDNLTVIFGTLLIYQLFLTIFFYSQENLIILAIITVIVAGYIIIINYKNDITSLFKWFFGYISKIRNYYR